ncbi:hypothetical protein CDAR_465441 [Caerostris darwini]|uniref:Uncharacterized protein n=1 Tax=Caerostris darwini TaxID=1538125 RepID=A0AAV4SCN0_9ARAC|nr:hypothetical protein CDAR_465441 [Caerostris darwini]
MTVERQINHAYTLAVNYHEFNLSLSKEFSPLPSIQHVIAPSGHIVFFMHSHHESEHFEDFGKVRRNAGAAVNYHEFNLSLSKEFSPLPSIQHVIAPGGHISFFMHNRNKSEPFEDFGNV